MTVEEPLTSWEIRFYKNFFIGFITSVLIAGFIVIYWYLNPKPQPPKPITSGTFHMKFGGAVCGEHYIDNCGVHIIKCDGGIEYHCMHDISFDLDNKISNL